MPLNGLISLIKEFLNYYYLKNLFIDTYVKIKVAIYLKWTGFSYNLRRVLGTFLYRYKTEFSFHFRRERV